MIRPDYDYLERIRRTFALTTTHRTTDLLDGEYASVYRGKSLDFDDLKEYVPGDDVRDIDWQASSRAGRPLIRRYVSDRRLDVLFVMDAGRHMLSDTSGGEAKDELALMTMGSLGYILGRQGADIAMCTPARRGGDELFTMFRSGTDHLERMMAELTKALSDGAELTGYEKESGESPLNSLIERVQDVVHRRLVLFIVTDTEGIADLDERVLSALTQRNDVFLLHLEDAYLTGEHVFDVMEGRYVRSKRLRRAELEERARIDARVRDLSRRHHIGLAVLRRGEEIVPAVRDSIGAWRDERWISSLQ